ncbi:hypothetical protein SAMN05660443_1455 [Marinospirillum celere]|uniref:Glucose-inhibited division protein B n=1 Tax=Marinospirillum celere TaxID=1122252 RepID=A0A1I1G8J0_9GAMM|nr:hypothetical protein [Marinospirillum celere]SFC07696.1 hypothetical protein SAMN05660443_1455 [Marinospirillum celere]
MKFKTGLVVALFVTLLVGCSGSTDEVSLDFLVLHSGSYDGRTLTVEGQVRGLEEPEHYWLEDDRYNRVGLSPDQEVKPYLDQSVRVTGRFEASGDKGRQIRVHQIEALE